MLEDIVAFRTIVLQKSLTKASKELGVSTPVITRRLARLEKTLQTQLIQRTTRHIHLTEAGELFFQQISDVLQALDASKEAVKNLNQEVSGTLKVGLPASISHLFVSTMLHKFTKQYPNVSIHLVTGNYLFDLLSQGFDLIIHAGTLPDSNFYYKKIGTWKKIFCATPAYLKKYGTPKTPQDLSSHNCIDRYDNVERVWDYKKKGLAKKIMITGNVRADHNLDIRNLALSGMGIAYLSRCTVHEDIQRGKLISILDEYQATEYGTYAVYPSKQFINKKTQIFIEFLSTCLKSVYGHMNG